MPEPSENKQAGDARPRIEDVFVNWTVRFFAGGDEGLIGPKGRIGGATFAGPVHHAFCADDEWLGLAIFHPRMAPKVIATAYVRRQFAEQVAMLGKHDRLTKPYEVCVGTSLIELEPPGLLERLNPDLELSGAE